MARATASRLSRRGIGLIAIISVVLCLLQAPGRIAADTKLDLAIDPSGFLSRALHLWSTQAPMGQVQNQAYGYFFPHGAFFLAGDLVGLPAWVTQRLWWAVLVTVGVVGVVRLAEALRIGSPGSRIVAAIAFVISPRVLTTLGSISSETLPMMLAPWVLLPVVLALNRDDPPHSVRRLALGSACAVALMGAVNAVATAAACAAAVVWWLCHTTIRGPGASRWRRFTAWWALGAVLACTWWVVPLMILSRVSPPFLDFIESSRVTTRWTSLVEVIRGTSSWTPFVSPDRVAGAVLVSSPVAVLVTGAVAAAGLAGLAMRSMPARGRLVAVAAVGIIVLCAGFEGQIGSPVAEQVRGFLDGPGAPLRNIHKFDPMIRLPLVLGIAHLLARMPLPGTVDLRSAGRAFSRPERSRAVSATIAFLVVLVGAGSVVWTGALAPRGAFSSIPGYWPAAATWLRDHAGPSSTPSRALVVPGAPFAYQTWGFTRDEPLQPLADTPWAVRDAIPLVPPGAIRAMDSVQRQIASGRPSPGLAATLAGQGIDYVVLRSDLAPTTSRSARPIVARQALTGSPGLREVAQFGPEVGPRDIRGVVGDDGLAPRMRAIEIYAVTPPSGAGRFDGTGPSLVDLNAMPRVIGGPEAVARLQDQAARAGAPPLGPTLLDTDARRAGLPERPAVVTDTPVDRETDFGRVDDHSSAVRAPDDRRSTQNAVPDYPVDGAGLVRGQWLLDGRPDEVSVSASGSASDATQLGQTSPSNSPAAAFDGDPNTSWISRDLDAAVGQWLQVDFARPRSDLAVTVTPGRSLGPAVTGLLVSTAAGTTVAQGITPGQPVTVVAPSGPTTYLQVRAISTATGRAGSQFAIAELRVRDNDVGRDLSISHRTVLPELDAGQPVSGWSLGQDGSRTDCAVGPDITRCSEGLGLAPEEPGLFDRVISVPTATTVVPRVWLRSTPGTALDDLVRDPRYVSATGSASITDPRASASAVVDGDPGTTWVAPDESTRPGAATPSVRITLPTARRVTGLTVTVPEGRYPARPTTVGVDLGTGRQIRKLPRDGHIDLDPAVTASVTVSVVAHDDLVDVNSLGFAETAPPGIAEIRLDGAPMATAPADRVVSVPCSAGIAMSVAGRRIPLSVTTTARRLVSGDAVAAVPCGGDTSVPLAAGSRSVTVAPSEAFSVDSVSLTAQTATPTTDGPDTMRPVAPTTWTADHRVADVAASGVDRVFVVPESTNPGWHATLDGRALRAVTVNGWQQGWIVPAGAAGAVTLDYPLDGPYRLAMLLGLIAVAVLFLAAALPDRRRRDEGAAPTPVHAPTVAIVGAAAVMVVLGGWVGAAAGVLTAVATITLRRRRPRVVPVAVAAMFGLGVVGLSWGPWASGDPYTGFDWWVTLPALVAVAGLATVSSPARGFVTRWASRRSRSRMARRAGSSTRP
ncbi:alpha-(1-_3)-arabinofuranosyltransferase domain-containing protein [Williamsia deligens]|uniref:Alpha-(1->3)-arabinofuranosyltransferase n=1 Tax=Williamsia deligens TaxID=321325 RepID=A0ABW3G544_9NOCA|nr:alpha-(1->3)-arabinofuranosyltransferase [Williamsia deligens]